MTKSILLIEDDKIVSRLIAEHIERMGCNVHATYTWEEAARYLEQHEPELVLMDVQLPDANGMDLLPQLAAAQTVIVITAYGSVKNAVKAMQAGIEDYLTKPISLDELEIILKRTLDNVSMRAEHLFCKQRMQASERKKLMVGNGPTIQEVHNLVDAVAETEMTVLIQGESGVGKELVAKTIHERSKRSIHNFVAVDCCTLQQTLFESELFGHERGAFTGADRQKKGLIEGASGGTLFLDEIGELELTLQAKLLRVLETGLFRRVGGTKDLSANVRIVAATNCDLEKASREGSFRSDLYYRLSAFTITVPPLRERREDIPDIVEHFVRNRDFSRRVNTKVTSSAMRLLMAYDWPGNIRELKNVIERALILSRQTRKIRPEHLAPILNSTESPGSLTLTFDHEPSLAEIEEKYLQMLLTKYSGHRLLIAKRLGVSERNIYRMIDKHRLKTRVHQGEE
ncbi:MAG: sigma-54 dependent transcriptional regulator [Gammaproteobacteria bacterium]|jgi:two-component system response regulator AtoC